MHFAAMGILGMIHDICVSLGNVYFYIFWDVDTVGRSEYLYLYNQISDIQCTREREREC